MRWNIPPEPTIRPAISYSLFSSFLLFIVIEVVLFLLVSQLKNFGLSAQTIDTATSILLGLIVLVVIIALSYILLISADYFETRTEIQKQQQYQRYWSEWGGRKIPIIGFSAYLPSILEQRLIKNSENIKEIKAADAENESDSGNLINLLLKDLIYTQFDALNKPISNRKIDVLLNTSHPNITDDIVKTIWLELGLPINQLGKIVKQTQSMEAFFTEFYANSTAQYVFIITVDMHSTGHLYAGAWLIHNADYLLDESERVVAYLPRLVSTDELNLSKSIHNLSLYQIPEKTVSTLWFCGLNNKQKQDIIQFSYQQKYYSNEQVITQIDLPDLVGATSETNDWFYFTCVIKQLLMLSNEFETSKLVIKQADTFTLGLVMKN